MSVEIQLSGKSSQTEHLIPEYIEHMIPDANEQLNPEHKQNNVKAKG
jgi:hypothetical protein